MELRDRQRMAEREEKERMFHSSDLSMDIRHRQRHELIIEDPNVGEVHRWRAGHSMSLDDEEQEEDSIPMDGTLEPQSFMMRHSAQRHKDILASRGLKEEAKALAKMAPEPVKERFKEIKEQRQDRKDPWKHAPTRYPKGYTGPRHDTEYLKK